MLNESTPSGLGLTELPPKVFANELEVFLPRVVTGRDGQLLYHIFMRREFRVSSLELGLQ